MAKGVGPRLKRKLETVFPLAVSRVREHGICRALFDDLDVAGSAALESTLYYSASVRQEQHFCRRGVSAFTQVGSRVTILCGSFAKLSPNLAAVILIHEGLHRAGMGERPADSKALDSAQINHLVRTSCSL